MPQGNTLELSMYLLAADGQPGQLLREGLCHGALQKTRGVEPTTKIRRKRPEGQGTAKKYRKSSAANS